MKRKDVIDSFKLLGVYASTADRTRKQLINYEDESCLLRTALETVGKTKK